MTAFVFVKPAEGGRVRMPDRGGAVMPATGATVQRIDYYESLIASKDLVECDPPKEEEAAKVDAPAADAHPSAPKPPPGPAGIKTNDTPKAPLK